MCTINDYIWINVIGKYGPIVPYRIFQAFFDNAARAALLTGVMNEKPARFLTIQFGADQRRNTRINFSSCWTETRKQPLYTVKQFMSQNYHFALEERNVWKYSSD